LELIMSLKDSDAVRYARYAQIVHAVRERNEFTVAEIKQVCVDVAPALVTRVIGALERDALLRRDEATSDRVGSRATVRWRIEPEQFPAAEWLDRQLYANRLARAPAEERPRERLLAHGAAALRTAELLAILIRSGRQGESALQAAETVVAAFAGCLERLPDANGGELKSLSAAIGETAYCQIMAGIELGRRVAAAAGDRARPRPRIKGPEDAIEFCRRRFQRLLEDGTQEEFHIVTLDTKHQPIDTHRISVGLLDQSIVHPREVFRPAIKDAAKAIILVHNHPSGDPQPSGADLAATDQMTAAGKMIGIEVLDHLIVASQGIVSVMETRGQP
jgi:DNA repair protein RadC